MSSATTTQTEKPIKPLENSAESSISEPAIAFSIKYKEYIKEQNDIFEKHGCFGEEWRVW